MTNDLSSNASGHVSLKSGHYTVLMGDRSRHSDSIHNKEFDTLLIRAWLENWNTPDQYFEWTVKTTREGKYRVDAIINLKSGISAEIIGPENTLIVGSQEEEWDRVEVEGSLNLPAGESIIRIQLQKQGEAKFRCLHLLNREDEKDFYARVKAFRSDTSWLRDAQFGLMFQWGGWVFPQHGDKKPWPQMIDNFDVEKFADMVNDTAAGYVVWSATWQKYLFPAPIKTIDDIEPGRTCERDLIGEIADSLKQRDIRFILYYHMGINTDFKFEGKNWKSSDDKELFIKAFSAITTEVGERYGKKLDGWMIDDGMIIAPLPFEKLGKALKAGNSNRIISYNSWILPRMTEFQDYHFGEENEWGKRGIGEPGSGIVSRGPQKGLQAHANFIFDGPGWGIHTPDITINPPRFDYDDLVKIAKNAGDKKIALSYNILIYEDGTVSQKSLDALKTVKKVIQGK